MTRRRRVLIGSTVVILLTAVALALVMICEPRSPINPDNLEKIKGGMTEREVVDILGPPSERRVNALAWEGDEWVADIYFDEGKVSATSYGPQTSFLSKLRRWFLR